MTTYRTSDTHLGDLKVALDRGFDTVAAHDEWATGLWRDVIKPTDQVIVLGDLGRPAHALPILGALPGTKHLVSGNHDRCHPAHRTARNSQRAYLEVFETVNSALTLRDQGVEFLASHFPYTGDHTEHDRHTQFRLRDEGAWLLHGHVHKEWKVRGRQINVGLDPWRRLVTLNELTKLRAASEPG
jgi:calcineurin-like phosphoesterase family protein